MDIACIRNNVENFHTVARDSVELFTFWQLFCQKFWRKLVAIHLLCVVSDIKKTCSIFRIALKRLFYSQNSIQLESNGCVLVLHGFSIWSNDHFIRNNSAVFVLICWLLPIPNHFCPRYQSAIEWTQRRCAKTIENFHHSKGYWSEEKILPNHSMSWRC